MLKIVSLFSSLFTVTLLASISQATTFQNHSTQIEPDVYLHSQRLVPAKKKADFKKMIIDNQLPINKNQKYQKINRDERTRINCERDFAPSSVSGGQYQPSERPDSRNLDSSNINNFNKTNRPNECSWGFSF